MSPVRSRFVYPIAWAVATALTVGVAWLGIRSVLVAAVPSRISPLSAADLRNAAPKPSPSPAPEPVPQPTPTPTVVAPPPTIPPATPPANAPATKVAPTPSDSWAPVPDGKGGTAYRRTFRTGGGDAVVLSGPGQVKIESSKPRAGFTVTIARQGDESVIVSFVGPRRSSRVWARWNNGPYAEVTEVTGFTS
jgi:hypothetical protein